MLTFWQWPSIFALVYFIYLPRISEEIEKVGPVVANNNK